MKPDLRKGRQRRFRKKWSVGPPMIGVWMRPGDLEALAEGVIPDRVRAMSRDALKTFYEPPKPPE